ncbi:helix-turn-helix domain-containing protein [Pseudonocardia endophytica]|uniref:Helix-turn-helix protein n=1 Tax=Pseudonocardia endophytica TaxID=401976 RepID=A0A4R1HM83_PSEEN|nr:helix-turn-helix domain-containing protein [Pseudonocardia endophytica]TCK22143.1 helix-turn-helix protein [Pseudonocardia endophytica]
MTGSDARRRELGRCLRAYRDLVRPAEVGLPATGRRRAPGLRREEVAMLAGVGVTWYTWLEQGRVMASGHVVDAVGRVLGIDGAGREHLRALSRPAGLDPFASGPESLRPLLGSWPSDPAVLLDARMDVVAANAAWTDAFGPPAEHVMATVVSVRPLDDVLPLVHALARRFRMVGDHLPGDERLTRVREGLRRVAPGLGPLWDCRGVGAFGGPEADVAGTRRRAYLLGDTGTPAPAAPAVLVLLPA